jgi:hypothetical protein
MTTPTPDRPTQPPAVPEELRRQWHGEWVANSLYTSSVYALDRERHMVDRAAAWAWTQREEEVQKAKQRGADAELEASIDVLRSLHLPDGYVTRLREARRPAPPTLREQALAVLDAKWGGTTDLRTAAAHILACKLKYLDGGPFDGGFNLGLQRAADELILIANELESQ